MFSHIRDCDSWMPSEAYLPADYVPDLRLKIDLYRRLARLTGFDDLQEFRDELVDRFGPLPSAVECLLAREELKIDAAIWQINEIYLEDRYLADNCPIDLQLRAAWIQPQPWLACAAR